MKRAQLAVLVILATLGVPQAAYAPPAKRPQVVTGHATAITQTAATLNGTVNPRGLATAYRFDYGTTTAYGSSTTSTNVGSGTTANGVSAHVTGLNPGTTYHFRLEASSSAGTTLGKDAHFTTLPRLTIAAHPAPVVFGSTTTITGQLQSGGNGGRTVELQANPYPYSGFATVATTTTDTAGHYSFASVKPTVNTRYRTVVKTPSATSAVVKVGVRIRLGRRASDTTPAKGDKVTFSGFACPAHNGAVVALQRHTSTGTWETVARTNLVQAATGALCANRSSYHVTVRTFHNRTFRAVAEHDADHLRGISRPIGIVVH
jgi:hypothetical protein